MFTQIIIIKIYSHCLKKSSMSPSRKERCDDTPALYTINFTKLLLMIIEYLLRWLRLALSVTILELSFLTFV